MAADGWHYLATTLNGDGTETLLAVDLPLSEVTINWALSAPTSLEATIPVEDPSLLADLVPFKTAIYAELDGSIRGAGILHTVDAGDAELGLSCVGWTAYLTGQPWPGSASQFVERDPFDIAKIFWNTAQSPNGADIGIDLDLDPDDTPVRLGQLPTTLFKKIAEWTPYTLALPKEGTPFIFLTDKSNKDTGIYGTATRTFAPSSSVETRQKQKWLVINNLTKKVFIVQGASSLANGLTLVGKLSSSTAPTNADGSELAPWPLTWWDVADMGSRWDDLAKDGGFDYAEDHRWSVSPGQLLPGNKVGIKHTLRCGHPQIGRTRNDLRFVVGENVIVVPSVESDGDYYADVIEVRGAGEGSAMKHAQWPVPNSDGRLRRVKVVTDSTILSTAGCQKRAQVLARAYANEQNIASLVVDTRNLDGWSWGMGDTITVQGSGKGWSGDAYMKVRITGASITPDSGDSVTLTVARSERVTDS